MRIRIHRFHWLISKLFNSMQLALLAELLLSTQLNNCTITPVTFPMLYVACLVVCHCMYLFYGLLLAANRFNWAGGRQGKECIERCLRRGRQAAVSPLSARGRCFIDWWTDVMTYLWTTSLLGTKCRLQWLFCPVLALMPAKTYHGQVLMAGSSCAIQSGVSNPTPPPPEPPNRPPSLPPTWLRIRWVSCLRLLPGQVWIPLVPMGTDAAGR